LSKSRKKTLLLVLLAISSTLLSSTLLNPITQVHAQGGFDYTLFNTRGITLTPGNSGSTAITATLTAGTPSNVTLSCDLTNLPNGTTCAFTPTSVTPNLKGNTTILTMTVPATTSYGAFNVTVTGKNPAPINTIIFVLTIAAKIAVHPTATADLSYKVGTSITLELNTTDSPPFSGLTAAIFINENVLQFRGIDYSGGVLGNDAQVSSECLDKRTVLGSSNTCNADLTFDDQGVYSLILFTSSGQNTTTPNGKFFSITFNVIGIGFSPIHFVFQEAQAQCNSNCHTIAALQTVGYDGYFTNEDCGSGNLCKPPVVSLIPPLRPVQYRPVSFNVTAASQNPNGVITEYNWTAGSGFAVQRYNSPSSLGVKPSTNATFTFQFTGGNGVTVSAQDNYGARAYYTIVVDVFRVWVDLGIAALNIDRIIGVIPGSIVHIVATAINNGVNPENSTISLSINNVNKTMISVKNLGPGNESSLRYDWNTAGYAPRVYEIVTNLDTVKDPITGQILENDTFRNSRHQIVDPNNVRLGFVQLIVSMPSGFGVFLGLTLPETLGLGIVLVAVIVFAAGLVKKSRAQPLEPL